jgi:hypothetical protein
LSLGLVDRNVAFIRLAGDGARIRVGIRLWLGPGWLGGTDVLANLVQVAFVHRDGGGSMAAESINSETGEIGQ